MRKQESSEPIYLEDFPKVVGCHWDHRGGTLDRKRIDNIPASAGDVHDTALPTQRPEYRDFQFIRGGRCIAASHEKQAFVAYVLVASLQRSTPAWAQPSIGRDEAL